MFGQFLFVVMMLVAAEAQQMTLQEFFTNVKTCKKTDPDIEACMKDLAEVIKPHLRNIVVPNVGALEPLAVRDMKVLGNQPNSMLSFTKSNVQLHNLDDFQLNSYKLDAATMTSHLEITFPKIRISGNYLLTTNFGETDNLILNMVGNMRSAGSANVTLHNVVTKSAIVGKVEGNHLVYTDFQIKMKIGEFEIFCESSDGPSALVDAINVLAKNCSGDMLIIQTPIYESFCNQMALEKLNEISSTVDIFSAFL